MNSSYKIFEISNPDCDNPFQISGGVSISMGENFQTDSILIYHILYIDYILKRHNFFYIQVIYTLLVPLIVIDGIILPKPDLNHASAAPKRFDSSPIPLFFFILIRFRTLIQKLNHQHSSDLDPWKSSGSGKIIRIISSGTTTLFFKS